MERLFVIEDIEAWCPSIRSASAIRSGYKREFIDPSIAVASLGLTPAYLEMDLKTFGFIFECMSIRDLKVYSQAIGGKVSYYHALKTELSKAQFSIINTSFIVRKKSPKYNA